MKDKKLDFEFWCQFDVEQKRILVLAVEIGDFGDEVGVDIRKIGLRCPFSTNQRIKIWESLANQHVRIFHISISYSIIIKQVYNRVYGKSTTFVHMQTN